MIFHLDQLYIFILIILVLNMFFFCICCMQVIAKQVIKEYGLKFDGTIKFIDGLGN